MCFSVFLRLRTSLGANTYGKSRTYENSNIENDEMVKIQTTEKKKYPRQLDATDNKRIYIGIFVQLTCRNVCIRILFARSHSNVTILWMTYVLLFFCRGYWLPLPMILFVVLNSLNFYSFASHEWNWSRGGANLPKKGRERGGDREKMKWKKNRKWEEK